MVCMNAAKAQTLEASRLKYNPLFLILYVHVSLAEWMSFVGSFLDGSSTVLLAC